jgi:hypothetical protein
VTPPNLILYYPEVGGSRLLRSKAAWRHIPEDGNLQSNHRDGLGSFLDSINSNTGRREGNRRETIVLFRREKRDCFKKDLEEIFSKNANLTDVYRIG